MASTARNAPCPCGSGKKYKHCHMQTPVDVTRSSVLVPVLLGLVAVAAGIFVGIQRSVGAGVSGAGGIGILLGVIWLLRIPPPAKGSKNDPGAINFGR